MTMLTFSYKKHYIHVINDGKSEKVEVHLMGMCGIHALHEIHVVKSIHAAKLFITKYVNSLK